MRIARTYTVDLELIEKLKGVNNASDLINTLLFQHFKAIEPKTAEEIDKEIARLKIKIDADAKLRALE